VSAVGFPASQVRLRIVICPPSRSLIVQKISLPPSARPFVLNRLATIFPPFSDLFEKQEEPAFEKFARSQDLEGVSLLPPLLPPPNNLDISPSTSFSFNPAVRDGIAVQELAGGPPVAAFSGNHTFCSSHFIFCQSQLVQLTKYASSWSVPRFFEIPHNCFLRLIYPPFFSQDVCLVLARVDRD